MNTKAKTIIGIDYSLTSPAVCITDDCKFVNSHFYYLTNRKKYIGKMMNNIEGFEHEEYTDNIKRFKNISNFVFHVLGRHISPKIGFRSINKIFIEGYSFGSKGQGLFQIAENCGILKYRLQMSPSMLYDTIVPSVVKKYASGKGNADKQLMYDSFKEHTKIDLMKMFDMEKLNNPVTDIVDSYYIAKVGYENSKSKK